MTPDHDPTDDLIANAFGDEEPPDVELLCRVDGEETWVPAEELHSYFRLLHQQAQRDIEQARLSDDGD